MFYLYDLLKKQGRFHICWIADAYPGSFYKLPSRKVRQYHVNQLCDDLSGVIDSEAVSPLQRFSLRLSSQLLFGLLRLYNRQLDLLIYDLITFDGAVRKGIELLHERPKKKKKSKIPTVFELEIPPQELDLVNLTNANVVQNVDQITLREETIPPTVVINDGFGDEQNPLLDLLGLPEDVLRMQDTSLQDQTTFQVQVEVYMDQMGRKSERVAIPPQDDHIMLDITKRPSQGLGVSIIELDEAQKTPNISNAMEDINLIDNIIDVPVIPEIVLPAPAINEEKIAETPGRTQEESMILATITTPPELTHRKRKKIRIDDDEKGKVIPSEVLKKNMFINNIYLRCELPSEDIETIGCHLTASRLLALPFLESREVRLSSHLLRGGEKLLHAFKRNLNTRPEPDHMRIKSLIRRKRPQREVVVAEQDQSNLRNITAASVTVDQTIEQMRTLPLIPEDMAQHQMMISSPLRKPTNLTATDPRKRKRSANLTIPNESRYSTNLPQIELQTTMNEITDIAMAEINMNATNIPTEVTTNMDTTPANNINVNLQIDNLLEEISAQRNISNVQNEEIRAEINQNLEVDDKLDKRGEDEILKDGSVSCRKSTNETGLGSLDRTKVSLGDEELTASQKAMPNYLSKEWDVDGLMEKVILAKQQKIRPLTLEKIVAGYDIPTDIVPTKFVMARAFMSLLRLKRSGFLNVKKNEDLTILHITIGEKVMKSIMMAQRGTHDT